MLYIKILLVLVIIIFLLKRISKKSKTPENIITYFFQALEVELLNQSLSNTELTNNISEIDHVLLISSGYFYSMGSSNDIKLTIEELELISSYIINVRKFEGANKKVNRLIFFIVMYKIAIQFKTQNKKISSNIESEFIKEVNNYNGIKEQGIVNKHWRDGAAPVAYIVLTKNLIKHNPNWYKLQFN